MNIIVDLNYPIKDGAELVFRTPVDCSQVTGLLVNYQDNGSQSKEFAFADAHGNNVGDIDHLFAANAVVKVILDLDASMAFVQNADTNAYLEKRFANAEDMIAINTIINDASGKNVKLEASSSLPFRELKVYGKSVQNGTPSPDAPVDFLNIGASGVIKLYLAGKNLAKYDLNIDKKNGVVKGIDVASEDDIMVVSAYHNTNIGTDNCGVLNLLTSTSGKYRAAQLINILPNTKYTLSSNMLINYLFYHNGNKVVDMVKPNKTQYTFTTPANCNRLLVNFLTESSSGTNYGEYKWIQLEIGDTATAYEYPTKEVQSFSFGLYDDLRGIQVAAGGNYTDESGQQWICDEVDFARGVYVQRIGQIDEYAGESISEPYLSTTGELTEGAEILYVLDTPIEIPIDEKILAEYAKLSPNKPCTSVYTDAGADLYVSYIADTKAYIDNKFNELATALVANS